MPLHDWAQMSGWDGVHLLWMSELLRYLKVRLPAGFRAYLGAGPAVAIGAPAAHPDVAIRAHAGTKTENLSSPEASSKEPDLEVAVAALDPAPALFVERDGRLISAIELVSPRNKDRAVARTTYAGRYAGYLIEGVHLLLIDVHHRPVGFSFAEQIAVEFQIAAGSLPPPAAVSYRVGEPAAQGGRLLAIWKYSMQVGAPLARAVLPLTTEASITIDLEATYMRAAADAYLS